MQTTAKQDRDKGIQALKYFYEAIEQNMIAEGHYLSFDNFVDMVESRRGGKAFISGLGLGIAFNEMSNEKVKEAMNTLAVKLSWQIPNSNTLFTEAINNRLQKYDVDFWQNVAVTTIEDAAGKVLDTASSVGGFALSTIFKSKKFMVLAGLGVSGILGYYLVMKKVKKVAKRKR